MLILLSPFFFALTILWVTPSVAADMRADAWYRIGYDYSQQKRNDDAFRYMLRAAKAGHIAAQNNIGLSYLHGLGVDKNQKKAFFWFEKSAKQGLSYAQSELAMLYYQQGSTQQAKYWWQVAANANDEYAQFNLASLFLEENSNKQAYYWLQKASAHNPPHPQAQSALKKLKETYDE